MRMKCTNSWISAIWRGNGKESTDYVKTIDFRQMYMKFGIATSKNHEHTIDIKISARGEWPTTVSFQPYGVGIQAPPPPSNPPPPYRKNRVCPLVMLQWRSIWKFVFYFFGNVLPLFLSPVVICLQIHFVVEQSLLVTIQILLSFALYSNSHLVLTLQGIGLKMCLLAI